MFFICLLIYLFIHLFIVWFVDYLKFSFGHVRLEVPIKHTHGSSPKQLLYEFEVQERLQGMRY